MIEVEIPGRGQLHLAHLVLDVNGTIVVGGELLPGVEQRLAELRPLLTVHLATADTRGRQAALDARLGLRAERVAAGQEREQKGALVRRLGAESVCYVGNGANDAAAMSEAALGIAVLQDEGLALETLLAADLVVPAVTAALDLLLHPLRLVASLRR